MGLIHELKLLLIITLCVLGASKIIGWFRVRRRLVDDIKTVEKMLVDKPKIDLPGYWDCGLRQSLDTLTFYVVYQGKEVLEFTYNKAAVFAMYKENEDIFVEENITMVEEMIKQTDREHIYELDLSDVENREKSFWDHF